MRVTDDELASESQGSPDAIWRDEDRFPLGRPGSVVAVSDDDPSGAGCRPFGLEFVTYSTGRAFRQPAVTLCPRRQVGLVDGEPADEVLPVEAKMTAYESDGQDVLQVDYADDPDD